MPCLSLESADTLRSSGVKHHWIFLENFKYGYRYSFIFSKYLLDFLKRKRKRIYKS